MRERPILFSGPMVRAILDGTKTQTRRIVKPQPTGAEYWTSFENTGFYPDRIGAEPSRLECPYGVPGDKLWVRESWWVVERVGQGVGAPFLLYDNEWDGNEPSTSAPLRPCLERFGHRPSIHMPRWASRITLEVTDVRVQRLQEITREDAIAEGLEWVSPTYGIHGIAASWHADPRESFRGLWESNSGKRAPWSGNPWCWAVSFRRVQP